MTDDEKNEFRRLLLEQRDTILEEAKSHREGDTPGLPGEDIVDRAERELERALDHRIVEGDANLLEKINVALKRLEEGSYDICARCGDSIPLERLRAKPAVSLCRACQQAKENGSIVESID